MYIIVTYLEIIKKIFHTLLKSGSCNELYILILLWYTYFYDIPINNGLYCELKKRDFSWRFFNLHTWREVEIKYYLNISVQLVSEDSKR